MHFCVSTVRGGCQGAFCCPRKMGTNWFMPAFVKSRFGESGRSDDEGTMVCSFSRKKSRKALADLRGGHEVDDYSANLPSAPIRCTSNERRCFSEGDQTRRALRGSLSRECVFVFLPFMIGIAGERPPEEASGASPVIQHDPFLERLAFGRDENDVMLGVGPGVRFGPVKLSVWSFSACRRKSNSVANW